MSKVPVLQSWFKLSPWQTARGTGAGTYCIAVSVGSSLNYDILGQKVTKKTSSQVYNWVMHVTSIHTENNGNHRILTPFSFLKGAAFAWGSLRCTPTPTVSEVLCSAPPRCITRTVNCMYDTWWILDFSDVVLNLSDAVLALESVDGLPLGHGDRGGGSNIKY